MTPMAISALNWEDNLKTLVLGIGNPILGNDGIGFHIARQLADKVKDESRDYNNNI